MGANGSVESMAASNALYLSEKALKNQTNASNLGDSSVGNRENVFTNTEKALRYAFNPYLIAEDRPVLNKLASPCFGDGNGPQLGDAGFIGSALSELSELHYHVLVARYAPTSERCGCGVACCSGGKPNKFWLKSIAWLTDNVRTTALAGCTSTYLLRRDYVAQHFKNQCKKDYVDLGREHGIDERTASAHAKKVKRYFSGESGKAGNPAKIGIEQAAYDAIDAKFKAVGVVD